MLKEQHPLLASLLPVKSLPDAVWITGATEMFNPDIPIKLHTATKVGHLTRKGDLDNLKVGDLVGVCDNRDGINKWRVIAPRGGKVELRRADRKRPDFALVKPAATHYTITDKIPLYHPEGIGVGLRRWGEPPLKSAFAIIQLTSQGWRPRTLLPEECWAIQGLDPDKLQHLQRLGASPEDIAAAAGNAITGAMATSVMLSLAPRYQQHQAAISGSAAMAYSLPLSTVPTSQLKQVHFIPVSMHPTPRCLLLRSWIRHLSLVHSIRCHPSSQIL